MVDRGGFVESTSASVSTHSVDIYAACARAALDHVPMTPRSANDKEYFPQDWLIDRFEEAGIPFVQQGRNGYPDFWAGGTSRPPIEGFEVKSLAFANGRPARRDFDCNSTIPSGRKLDRDVFLAFFLYTGGGASPRPVHSLSIAHVDLVNSDYAVADAHANVAIHRFGSYGDGFIRNRKMYVFPHPLSIDPGGLGRFRLIVPVEWGVEDERLVRVGQLQRDVASDYVESYTVELLRHGEVEANRSPYADAGTRRVFEVFELRR